jgi:hypothetical protein
MNNKAIRDYLKNTLKNYPSEKEPSLSYDEVEGAMKLFSESFIKNNFIKAIDNKN